MAEFRVSFTIEVEYDSEPNLESVEEKLQEVIDENAEEIGIDDSHSMQIERLR